MTPQELQELIDYDPETGDLTWKARKPEMFNDENQSQQTSWNTRYAGTPALATVINGFKRGKIFGKQFYAHRVAFAIHTGLMPEVVEHISDDTLDNRPENLRASDYSAVAYAREAK